MWKRVLPVCNPCLRFVCGSALWNLWIRPYCSVKLWISACCRLALSPKTTQTSVLGHARACGHQGNSQVKQQISSASLVSSVRLGWPSVRFLFVWLLDQMHLKFIPFLRLLCPFVFNLWRLIKVTYMNGMLSMSLGGEPGHPVKCHQYLGKWGIQQKFLVYCMLPPN